MKKPNTRMNHNKAIRSKEQIARRNAPLGYLWLKDYCKLTGTSYSSARSRLYGSMKSVGSYRYVPAPEKKRTPK